MDEDRGVYDYIAKIGLIKRIYFIENGIIYSGPESGIAGSRDSVLEITLMD